MPVLPVAEYAFIVHNCTMIRLSKDQVHKGWQYLEDGVKPGTIALLLTTDERTVARLRSVMKGFNEERTNKELATPEWKVDTIAELREWWEDYQRSKSTWARKQHLDSLATLAQKLRDRIINPEINRRHYGGKSIWFWANQDWRLVPETWLRMMVPYLEDRKIWGLHFNNLMSHLVDSRFEKDYVEITEKALSLEKELSKVAKDELQRQDPVAYQAWKTIEVALEDYYGITVDNFEPDVIPTPSNIVPLPYSHDICEQMMARFIESIPDLNTKFNDMEKLLQQLWDDLDPDEIAFKIEQGKCERCSGVESQ